MLGCTRCHYSLLHFQKIESSDAHSHSFSYCSNCGAKFEVTQTEISPPTKPLEGRVAKVRRLVNQQSEE